MTGPIVRPEFGVDRRALSTAITQVENGNLSVADTLPGTGGPEADPLVVGVTGPLGAGKSTLVGALVSDLLSMGHRVGVLLVDPSSPRTGGAVLADRIRMPRHARNPELYVRSLGSRGHAGGVTRTTGVVLGLLGRWGADVVLVETVGAGQGDVAICALVDFTVMVCPPGLGDEFQAMKAGLMELADLFIVNKADRPGAAETASTLTQVAGHGPDGRLRPVLRTVATTGEGVPDLAAEIERRRGDRSAESGRRLSFEKSRHALASRAGTHVYAEILSYKESDMTEIVDSVRKGRLDLDAAVYLAMGIVGRR